MEKVWERGQRVTYCISDIHGQYDLFMKLLDKIRYSHSDRLIVCGDIVEKGPASIRLAQAIFELPNTYCIMGNHEYRFAQYYRTMMSYVSSNFEAVLQRMQEYFPEDGHLLNWETLDLLTELPLYLEEENFLCVHAGLPLSPEGIPAHPADAAPEQLLYDRKFKEPEVLPRGEKCIFFGHTPTYYIHNRPEIVAYPRRGAAAGSSDIRDYCKVHLDTGVCQTGVLGCFRVDDCRAFYVQKEM